MPSRGAVTSRNFCALGPLHNFPAGEERGYWGGPIALFRTTGGTPYRYHLHVKDLGSTFVSGASGSGKSTWLCFVVCQAERSGAQAVVWDKDRGLEILVRAMGGSYLPLRMLTGLSLLKGLDDTEDNRAFQARLVRGLIAAGSADAFEMTNEEERRLHVGLRAVMSLPVEKRSLRELRAFLGVGPNGAGARLEKWCWGEEFGGVVDCPEDTLRSDAPVMGFDQTDILDDPMARGPVLSLLFHRTESLIDGRRMLFVVDEFWRSLQDAAFRDVLHDSLKTFRKRGVPLLLATQSPRDAHNSPIAHTVMEQCASSVSFANGRATWEDYGDNGMRLTRPEFDIVRGIPEGSGQFLLKQARRASSRNCRWPGWRTRSPSCPAARKRVRVLHRARELAGEDPASLLPTFHRLRKELRMKAALLPRATLLALTAATPAKAQIPVTDVANLQEQIVHYGQMLLQYARQGQELAQEAQLVETQATMLMNFVHDPSLGAAMGLMGRRGLLEVFNKGDCSGAGYNPGTGTTSPDVMRVTKR